MARTRYAEWAAAFVLTVIAVAIAYQWLDRPIAYFSASHRQPGYQAFFDLLTRIPEIFSVVAIVVFVLIGLRGLSGRPLSRLEAVVLTSGLGLIVAASIKNQLKYIFGRTWPETWINKNPSLIRDGVYGFNPFHGGLGYESFPSGHTTVVCAVVSVFWLCYPKYRLVYVVIIAAVVVGLLGADYHFLSDIIAGGFIGASTGWIAVTLWNAGGPTSLFIGADSQMANAQPLQTSGGRAQPQPSAGDS